MVGGDGGVDLGVVGGERGDGVVVALGNWLGGAGEIRNQPFAVLLG